MKKGKFIAIEGIDGSGKTSQINLLKERIQKTNHAVYTTQEPSDGPFGAMLRQFLRGRMSTDESALATLFAADRLDHLSNNSDGLMDKINRGTTVICDRYLLSSYAYQSVRSPLDWVKDLNRVARDLQKVDCHIFINVSPELAIKRIAHGRQGRELFETTERLEAVRNKYLSIIEDLKDEENIIVIDGDKSIEEISDDIWAGVSHLFENNDH